jgi:transposase
MITYAGLDVHKRVVEACVLDAAGAVVHRARFDLTPANLIAFAQQHLGPEAHVALEATTNTWAVVRILKPYVARVVVSNPLATKAIATAKVKTDKVDALVLAQLLRCDYLPTVWEPDERTQELRRVCNRRAALVADRTAVKNRLHAVLAERLLVPPGQDLFSVKGLAWLKAVALDEVGTLARDSDLRLLSYLEVEIAALDQVLAKKGYATPAVKLLMTLPGVDVTCAQTLLAALGDVTRFTDGAHAAAYLGLAPSTKQSGAHCYHGSITKRGNGHARWMLVQAAQHVAKHPGPLGVFFRRLAKKKNRNVAVVATARKLVVLAWHLLTKNEPYRYAQPKTTEAKLARLRVKATGGKRKTGPAKGTKAKARVATPTPTRKVKTLPAVLAAEGLPALVPAPAGEARTVAATGTAAFVASLAQEQRERRSPPRPVQPKTRSTASAGSP